MRTHFDIVLMICTGRVVPHLEPDSDKVELLGKAKEPLDELYAVLSEIVGRPVYTHDIPGVLWIVAPYFKKEYPEIRENIEFPLVWEMYESWRGSFLTEHDLPDWYDVPVINPDKILSGKVKRGTRLEFILPHKKVSVLVP